MSDSFIPLSTPWIGGNEKQYLIECVDTGWLAAGPFINRFENAVSEYLDLPQVVATSSGTAALEVALRTLGIGEGDEVICPSLTFVATSNAIVHAGARPAYVDTNRETWGIDPEALSRALNEGCHQLPNGNVVDSKSGRRVGAVIVVHLYGHPANMDAILEVTSNYGLPVIEDATESLGASYKGTPTGTLGDIGCLSFNGNKTITSGGGGMIISRDQNLLSKARYLINQAKDPGDEFHHSEIGFNYRLSNLHAAVGLAQFEQLHTFLKGRKSHALRYEVAFSDNPGITFSKEPEGSQSSYWLSTVLLDPDQFALSPAEVVTDMKDHGIEVRRLFIPNHMLPPYQKERVFGDLSVTRSLYDRGLNLPSSSWLQDHEVDKVINRLAELSRHISL